MMRRLSDRPRSVVLALAGILAIGALVVLGGLSLLPRTGLHCPHPGARVMLDPGHGGDDPGAINDAAGLVERELVLDIARRTQARLEQAGYSVALTRSDPTTGYANTPRGQMANLCKPPSTSHCISTASVNPSRTTPRRFGAAKRKMPPSAPSCRRRWCPGCNRGLTWETLASRCWKTGCRRHGCRRCWSSRSFCRIRGSCAPRRPEWGTAGGDCGGGGRGRRCLAAIEAAWAARDTGAQWPRARVHATAEDPLLAAPRGSAARALVSALQAEARRPEEVRATAEVYRLAPLVGLDPAIVIAQSAHETGWRQSPAWTDHLNPAGIGITGADVASPSWERWTAARPPGHLFYAAGRFHPAIP